MDSSKQLVHDFWDAASCGEALYLERDNYAEQSRRRYAIEPYIPAFAKFDESRGKRVLEVGVGLGADHERFARAGAILSGVDLTVRAVTHTRKRLAQLNLQSALQTADAEHLPFENASFDAVYSWGVLHHTPRTDAAIAEVHRVLAPGGEARVMLYNRHSVIGAMLWTRYALMKLRPVGLRTVFAERMESPGTQAFTPAEARALFAAFRDVHVEVVLTHGDLLTSDAGQRHRGPLLTLAKAVWPRWLIRTFFGWAGFFLLITARK